jgi:Uma2 family endonuclease
MHVVLPDEEFRIGSDRLIDDNEFFALCAENRDLCIEREPNGEIIIMPPPGAETGYRNNDLAVQLGTWAKRDRRAFDSSTDFFLPSGAAYRPDASWVRVSRLAQFTKEQKRRFLYLCPDFVIELMSPSDRLSKAQAKMSMWMVNTAELGWLIDADTRSVYIYRPGRDPEQLVDVGHVEGEGPVEGLRLDLTDIWLGL